jgi:hypothetical protein
MFTVFEPPLLTQLRACRRVLIAGAGGGFDVYAGLPLYLGLRALGKEVHLANLTFTYLGETDAPRLAPNLAVVTPTVRGADGYFPERRLAEWLESNGHPARVYAFEKTGVRPLRDAYARLAREHALDAIVLADGGTDILLRGDEAGLGTPEEDMTSLAALAPLVATGDGGLRGFVASLGFGIDAYHGVCHTHVLENLAALERSGGYLGAFSVTSAMPEGRAFVDAVRWAHERTPGRPSIVNGQIAAAVDGQFGDVHFTERTAGSTLFVNPLMALYFACDLGALAARSLYLPMLEGTETIFEVAARIEAFRRTLPASAIRDRRPFPH